MRDQHWHEGTLAMGIEAGSTIFHYWVKAYEEPSEFGIDGGKISKLLVRKGNKEIMSYDRGWDFHPDPDDNEAQACLSILLNSYN